MNSTMTTTPWEQVRQEFLAAMTETERTEYDAAAIEAEARLQRLTVQAVLTGPAVPVVLTLQASCRLTVRYPGLRL